MKTKLISLAALLLVLVLAASRITYGEDDAELVMEDATALAVFAL